jgi:hypothetical protein
MYLFPVNGRPKKANEGRKVVKKNVLDRCVTFHICSVFFKVEQKVCFYKHLIMNCLYKYS